MTPQFYIQKSSFEKRIISSTSKFKSWPKVFMALLISFVSLSSSAQTITNVAISPTVFCPGSKVSISFTVTNGISSTNYFKSSTTYTIYVTNVSGNNFGPLFASSSPSAPPPSADGGTAVITFSNLTAPSAAALPPGTAYKISIGADVPSIVVNSGTNVSAPFTVAANPTISYSKVFVSCQGNDGSINVTANGGASPYTYTWTGYPTSGSYSGSTQAITALPVGGYTVVVKDNNGCTATVPGIAIRQAPSVGVGVSENIPTCAGNDGSISAFRIGGTDDGITPIQYNINGGAYQASGIFSGLIAASYTITAKDSKGCIGSLVVNLPADPRPAPTVGILQQNSPGCAGNDGSISAFRIGGVNDGIHPVQYKLDGEATIAYQNSNVFSGLSAGSYTLTVKDSRGCTGTLAVNLPVDSRPVPSVGFQMTNPGCSGNDGTISAYRIAGVYDGVNPIQFNIDGGAYQTSGLFSGLSAGTHTVTVKDSRGCSGNAAIVLTQAEQLVFTSNGYNTNISACGGGSDGSIVATVSGGVTPYHYILDGVEKGISSLRTFGFGSLQANVSYTITVTDSKGCSISKNVTLSQESAPVAVVNYTGNATCMGGSNGFITAWQSGGVPGYMYSKDGGATYQSSYRFLDLTAGTYNVVVKDSKGCVGTTVPVTIADGIGNCPMARVGDFNSNNTTANREGNTNNYSALSKSALNTSLSIQSYPNPFTSEFTLDIKGNYTDKVSLIVTDVLGRRWYQAQGDANQQYKLGSTLRSGIYFVQVMQGNNVQTIKIVKE